MNTEENEQALVRFMNEGEKLFGAFLTKHWTPEETKARRAEEAFMRDFYDARLKLGKLTGVELYTKHIELAKDYLEKAQSIGGYPLAHMVAHVAGAETQLAQFLAAEAEAKRRLPEQKKSVEGLAELLADAIDNAECYYDEVAGDLEPWEDGYAEPIGTTCYNFIDTVKLVKHLIELGVIVVDKD